MEDHNILRAAVQAGAVLPNLDADMLAGAALVGGPAGVLSGLVEPPNPNSIGGSKYNPVGLGSVLVLNAQVDTAYCNIKVDAVAFAALEQQLALWKLEAQASVERLKRLDLGGREYFMKPTGRVHYAYVLVVAGYGEVQITYNERFLGARVRLYSEWLAGVVDMAEIEQGARALVAGLFGDENILTVQPSEWHVAVDVAGLEITLADLQQDRFKCRADLQPAVWDYQAPGGVALSLAWGKHGSPVSVAIYNKGREIEEKSPQKAYLYDKWRAAGWDGQSAVMRVEFRYTRERLREFACEAVCDLDPAALFAYGMQWLELRVPDSDDSNKARWSVDPTWAAITEQGCKLLGEQWTAYKRQYEPRASVDMLIKQAGGCVASAAALLGIDAVDDLFMFAKAYYLQALDRRGVDFTVEVERRCDRFMVPVVGARRGAGAVADHPAVGVARRD